MRTPRRHFSLTRQPQRPLGRPTKPANAHRLWKRTRGPSRGEGFGEAPGTRRVPFRDHLRLKERANSPPTARQRPANGPPTVPQRHRPWLGAAGPSTSRSPLRRDCDRQQRRAEVQRQGAGRAAPRSRPGNVVSRPAAFRGWLLGRNYNSQRASGHARQAPRRYWPTGPVH